MGEKYLIIWDPPLANGNGCDDPPCCAPLAPPLCLMSCGNLLFHKVHVCFIGFAFSGEICLDCCGCCGCCAVVGDSPGKVGSVYTSIWPATSSSSSENPPTELISSSDSSSSPASSAASLLAYLDTYSGRIHRFCQHTPHPLPYFKF